MRNKVIALEYESYRVVSVGVPVRVLVLLGTDTVNYKVSACIMIKTTHDVKQGGLTSAGGAED